MEGLLYVVIGALLVGWGWLRLRAGRESGEGVGATQFLYGLTMFFGVVAVVAGSLLLFG